jgi:hypothetical protein
MAVRPSQLDSADGSREIDELNAIRLDRDWSYQELADDMEAAGHGVPSKTLHALLTQRPKPYDRTLYKIRKYLEHLRTASGGRKRAAS